jgi:3-oxoacyl-[acyl-carrier-protein] synthase II
LGLVTPTGITTAQTWHALCAGTSGITELHDPLLAEYPVRIAGSVTGEQEALNEVLSPREQDRTDRFIHLAMLAATEAMQQARIEEVAEDTRERAGVYLGVSVGGVHTIVDAVNECARTGVRRVSPFLIPKLINNEGASAISIRWGLKGPVMSVSSACSSGSDAIGQAYQAIMSGQTDLMVAGGAESATTPVTVGGFGNMRALAQWKGVPSQASRPFDAQRCGFVIAEGAGILVLEEYDAARTRGAAIIGEIVGYGCTADAYHTTALHPEGEGGQRAMVSALQQAGVTPDQIGYINAHGTSTRMNDAVETAIIKKVLGEAAYNVAISSTKSMMGHTLGAAGGIEAGIALLALQHQVAPPTINLQTLDPACDLNYTPHKAQSFNGDYALSNSFGFGGSNAVLIMKRY